MTEQIASIAVALDIPSNELWSALCSAERWDAIFSVILGVVICVFGFLLGNASSQRNDDGWVALIIIVMVIGGSVHAVNNIPIVITPEKAALSSLVQIMKEECHGKKD